MDAAKQWLRDKNILPFISFKDKPRHTVTLIEANQDKMKDREGKDIEGMSFIVEEFGEKKKFFTGSISLISQLAEFNIGDTVTISMKSKKVDGQFKSYFEVEGSSKVGNLPRESEEEYNERMRREGEDEVGETAF